MVRLRLLVLAATAGLLSSAAWAFQEQQAPVGRSESAPPAAVVAPLAPDAIGNPKGTPIRIPGLGTLGVIPKMDFGLELLYGATESSKRADPTKPEQDDVLVGGRIKHKF